MKNVFINNRGEMSLTKSPDSVKVGQIHRLQGAGTFDMEIEQMNLNELPAEKATIERAYKMQQSAYSSADTTICYVDNIQPIQ
jgi:hypothetical protein